MENVLKPGVIYGYVSSFVKEDEEKFHGHISVSKKRHFTFNQNNIAIGCKVPELYSYVQFEVQEDPVTRKSYASKIKETEHCRLGFIYKTGYNQDKEMSYGFLQDCTPFGGGKDIIIENKKKTFNKPENTSLDGIYFNQYTYQLTNNTNEQEDEAKKGSYVLYDVDRNKKDNRPVAKVYSKIEPDRVGYVELCFSLGGVVVDCMTGEKYCFYYLPLYFLDEGLVPLVRFTYVRFGMAISPINQPYAVIFRTLSKDEIPTETYKYTNEEAIKKYSDCRQEWKKKIQEQHEKKQEEKKKKQIQEEKRKLSLINNDSEDEKNLMRGVVLDTKSDFGWIRNVITSERIIFYFSDNVNSMTLRSDDTVTFTESFYKNKKGKEKRKAVLVTKVNDSSLNQVIIVVEQTDGGYNRRIWLKDVAIAEKGLVLRLGKRRDLPFD